MRNNPTQLPDLRKIEGPGFWRVFKSLLQIPLGLAFWCTVINLLATKQAAAIFSELMNALSTVFLHFAALFGG